MLPLGCCNFLFYLLEDTYFSCFIFVTLIYWPIIDDAKEGKLGVIKGREWQVEGQPWIILSLPWPYVALWSVNPSVKSALMLEVCLSETCNKALISKLEKRQALWKKIYYVEHLPQISAQRFHDPEIDVSHLLLIVTIVSVV